MSAWGEKKNCIAAIPWLTFKFNGVVEHSSCTKITPSTQYGAYTVMICPFLTIPQLKQEKSYFFCNTYFYFLYYDQSMKYKSIWCKNNMISSILIGGFVEME